MKKLTTADVDVARRLGLPRSLCTDGLPQEAGGWRFSLAGTLTTALEWLADADVDVDDVARRGDVVLGRDPNGDRVCMGPAGDSVVLDEGNGFEPVPLNGTPDQLRASLEAWAAWHSVEGDVVDRVRAGRGEVVEAEFRATCERLREIDASHWRFKGAWPRYMAMTVERLSLAALHEWAARLARSLPEPPPAPLVIPEGDDFL